jgi:mannose-6-phosphate isomerase-like protein (cupin superfamily)
MNSREPSEMVSPSSPTPVQRTPEVITRAEIPALHTVMEGGREHVLGILKEFRRHERLGAFLPKDYRVAIAWVHLDRGQTLEPHIHPVDSMILICRGSVLALGDREVELHEGDILLVPHDSRHGFTGSGIDGFWGISMQFDSRGLYEDINDPWASFLDADVASRVNTAETPFSLLIAENDRYLTHFSKHRLFTMAQHGFFATDRRRGRFFDCFQVWSNYFQRMLQLRAAVTEDTVYATLAQGHLHEELGHNTLLQGDRDQFRSIWDPLLESSCAWFTWKMMSLGDLERVVLVHLVVEASAGVFYKEMAAVMGHPEAANHLNAHRGTTDNRHLDMGLDFLKYTPLGAVDRLLAIQKQGWDMLGALFSRMADLVAMSE